MFFNKYKDILTDNNKTKLSPFFSLLGGMAAGCFSTLCLLFIFILFFYDLYTALIFILKLCVL
jgi:hypothetical protein